MRSASIDAASTVGTTTLTKISQQTHVAVPPTILMQLTLFRFLSSIVRDYRTWRVTH